MIISLDESNNVQIQLTEHGSPATVITNQEGKAIDVEALSGRAALATFSCSAWSGKKKDPRIGQVAKMQHDHDGTTGTYRMLLEEGVKPILKARASGYQTQYKYTAPWERKGRGIIKATSIPRYLDDMRRDCRDFYASVHFLRDHYEDLLREDEKIWNGWFNPKDYPSLEVLMKKYNFVHHLDPLIVGADWRLIDLGEELREELQADLTAQTEQRLAAAVRFAWDKLQTAVAHLAKILKNGEPRHLKQTTIDAVLEVAGGLSDLNFLDDPQLEAMRQEVEDQLTGVDAALLRDSVDEHETTRKKVEEMMSQMNAVMA